MRAVFMGTPEFAVPSLAALDNYCEVLAVVCQPDRPNARGKKIVSGAVKQEAIKRNIRIMQPESVRDKGFIGELHALSPDIVVVAAYGQLLPEEILKINAVNVHASLLPKYRGAAPVHWAIINGETRTGITIMQMDTGLDTGDMLEAESIPIDENDTCGSLTAKLSHLGAEVLLNALSKIERGTLSAVKQDDKMSSYAPLIKKETGRINWGRPAQSIVNLIRGLNPAPGAYSEFEGRKIKVLEAFENFSGCEYVQGQTSDFGMVIDVSEKRGIMVLAENSCVLITRLQQEGGKQLSAADYIRGHEMLAGMKFK
jgi:methionyl-tRNA formyltransferase